ncbi:hypothetical protein KKB83_01725 [Patescibacteria group bacterium]|nr:hypothetical protein [Patescibacteria group bacterium]
MGEVDFTPILVGADMMKTEEFDFIPRMNVPLALTELQEFFKKAAREMTGELVE